MQILITNDDGINAPGLKTLQKIAETLAGAAGEVWTVAPSTERSGVAHAISLSSPVLISQLGPRSFSIDGYPADCVLAGLHHILKGSPPDIILSGVNRGNNSAENALYSGTLGAAIEGALQGVPSFALSQYLGPNNVNINDPFEASAAYGAEVVQAILSANPPASQEYQLFYNINFPPCPAEWVKGRKLAMQGFRRGLIRQQTAVTFYSSKAVISRLQPHRKAMLRQISKNTFPLRLCVQISPITKP